MKPSNDQPVDAIDLALRDDAARWDAGPTRDFATPFREPVAVRTRRTPVGWLAAALVVGLISWWVWTSDPRDVEVAGSRFDVRAQVARVLEPARVLQPARDVVIHPLETELRAVTEDAEAIADVVWRGVRQPVARWLSESE